MNNDFQTSMQNNANSFGDKAKAAWATVPLFVRFMIIISVSFYVLSWFLPLEEYLTNIPYYSIGSFQVWRFFTSTFINTSIFNLIFAFIFWIPDAMRLENISGTVRYSLNFIINSVLVNILFAITLALLSVIIQSSYILYFVSNGLWPVIMSEITMLCIANPEESINFLSLPLPVKSMYYPWLLVAFMSLISFSIRFDLLAGIAYGYIFSLFLRQRLHFDDNTIIQWENNNIVKNVGAYTGFIPLQLAQSYSGFNNNTNANTNNSNNNYQQHQDHYNASSYSNNSQNFKGKGTAVGK